MAAIAGFLLGAQAETSVLEMLARLDREEERARAALAQSQAEVGAIYREESRIAHLQAEVRDEEARLRHRLGRRLRHMYMLGEVGTFDLIFGADSISAGLEQIHVLTRLAEHDRALGAELRRARTRLNLIGRDLEVRRAALVQAKALLEERSQAFSRQKADRLSAAERVRRDLSLSRKAALELESAHGRLTSLVGALDPADVQGFAGRRGRLPSPCPAAALEVPYGKQRDERFGTLTLHQGVDLRGDLGASVQAVFAGQVAFAEIFPGYGRLVILDHGQGYHTLYAHLDACLVHKGDRVLQGQVIGTLGDSGSLKGAFLYFEVRRRGIAVDPGQWVDLGGR